MQSVKISEATLDFSNVGARSKRVGSSSQTSTFRRDKDADEHGSVKHDRGLASTSHSYASVSNAKGRKDAQRSWFGGDGNGDDDDAISSVSTSRKARDTDQESDVILFDCCSIR